MSGEERSSPSPGEARLFFALWPDERVRAALAEIAREAHASCGGRQIRADKIHLTLFFLGNVARARIPALEALAASLPGAPVELDLETLGYWRHNGIVWAGTRACPSALSALVAALRGALAREGYEEEERAYVPHVTLVRNAKRAPRRKAMPAVRWRARDFVLVESVQAQGVARYEVIARWGLAGS